MYEESIFEQSLIAKSTARSDHKITRPLTRLRGVGTSPQAQGGAKIDIGGIALQRGGEYPP